MSNTIRMRAALQGDVCEVRAMLAHPMETGQRKHPETGLAVPAHFIQEVRCTLNDRPVMSAYWGPGVSANPFLSFRFRGASSGDTVTLSWVDNKGGQASASTRVG